MKIYILLILGLIFLFCQDNFAQQWAPVNAACKYNYSFDADSLVTNVIKTDSSKIIDGDSVFYFNLITDHSWNYLLLNRPEFLKKKMIKKPGGIYIFSDPGSYTIMSQAGIGSGWIFDTASGLTAQVTGLSYEPVFGQIDSVKLILLSNGKEIRLSKNHGLLSFPATGVEKDYHLKGIAGPDLGILLPGFFDIFNFNVDDIFQYYTLRNDYTIGGINTFTYIDKIKILEKEIETDEINYKVFAMSKMMIYSYLEFFIDTVTITYKKSDFPFAESEPQEPIQNNSYYQIVQPASENEKIMGPVFYEHISGDTIVFNKGGTSIQKLKRNLGITYEDVYKFDVRFYALSYLHELTAYVINGDTTGDIYPDTYFLGINEPENLVVKIFPVPSTDDIHFILPDNVKRMVEYVIYCSEGRLVRKGTLDAGDPRINIKSLSEGIYCLVIRADNFLGSNKFIKISN